MRSRRHSGSALVEFAIVSTLVFILLFGIIEFGALFKDLSVLQQATREGGRAGGIGQTPAQIVTTVTAAVPTLDTTLLAVSSKYSTDSGATYSALGTSGSENNAPSGSLVKVSAIYQHRWLTQFIFRGTKQISSAAVVRRE